MSTKTIWKFPLEITDAQTVRLPKGAEVLKVDRDPVGDLSVWAHVDPAAETEDRLLHIVGTGNPMPTAVGPAEHVGSVVDSPFVWHVFLSR